jgi:hypothetical protein
VNVLLWHVHGAWTTSFVRGPHQYLVPVVPDRGAEGRGRAQTYEWPEEVREVTAEEARREPIDAVILQRPEEMGELWERWLGDRRPGRDVAAVYVEHNRPQGRVNEMRHPAADRDDLVLVHVSHFNRVMWDAGSTRVSVIEHGIVDPGHHFTGELPRAVAAINEPGRRARVVGADLLSLFERAAPVDLFGIGVQDLPQWRLHEEMARRRVYLHPFRWTSLGLSLLEAMHLGLPVVALATSETPAAVPPEAGVVSNDLEELSEALAWLTRDPKAGRRMGEAGRESARARYGLERFLADWDALLQEVAS